MPGSAAEIKTIKLVSKTRMERRPLYSRCHRQRRIARFAPGAHGLHHQSLARMTDLLEGLLADNTGVEAIHHQHLLAFPGQCADQDIVRYEGLQGALRPQEKLVAPPDPQGSLDGALQVFLLLDRQYEECFVHGTPNRKAGSDLLPQGLLPVVRP